MALVQVQRVLSGMSAKHTCDWNLFFVQTFICAAGSERHCQPPTLFCGINRRRSRSPAYQNAVRRRSRRLRLQTSEFFFFAGTDLWIIDRCCLFVSTLLVLISNIPFAGDTWISKVLNGLNFLFFGKIWTELFKGQVHNNRVFLAEEEDQAAN